MKPYNKTDILKTKLEVEIEKLKTEIKELNDSLVYKENQLKLLDTTKYEAFLNTYSGKQLKGKHLLSEVGIWEVYGEDPNCDLGGTHHEPFLGIYEGTLDNVIKHAVHLPGFWSWGGGGRIKKRDELKIIKV